MDPTFWEKLAFQIAKGWFKAYYEVYDERCRVQEEQTTKLDAARTDAFRDKLRLQEGYRPPKS